MEAQQKLQFRAFDPRDIREGMPYLIWHTLADWLYDHGLGQLPADELAMRVAYEPDDPDVIVYDTGRGLRAMVGYEYDGAADGQRLTVLSLSLRESV